MSFFKQFKNKQFILFGCVLLLSIIATILSIICIAYLVNNTTVTIPGWPKTKCTVTQVLITNNTLTPACDCLEVDVWAISPLCQAPSLMAIGFHANCTQTPGCVEGHFYPSQVLDCYINPTCETFETTMNHPPSTSDSYGPIIIALILTVISFVILSIYATYQIIQEYRYVQIMELERLIDL